LGWCPEIYLSGSWDEINRNQVCFIEFLAVHSEVFGVPDISALSGASSGNIIVFEKNAAYFGHIASRFALDADEFAVSSQ